MYALLTRFLTIFIYRNKCQFHIYHAVKNHNPIKLLNYTINLHKSASSYISYTSSLELYVPQAQIKLSYHRLCHGMLNV